MKYIMLQTTPQNEQEKRFIPIIFPKELVHAHVAMAIIAVLKHQGIGPVAVRSAGEVTLSITPGDVICEGNSSTLARVAHEDDANIIRLCDYHCGMAELIDMTCVIIDKALKESGSHLRGKKV